MMATSPLAPTRSPATAETPPSGLLACLRGPWAGARGGP